MNPEPIQPPGIEGFRFEWREPQDAEMSWRRDDMHAPLALAPLAADYFELIAEGFSYRYEKLEIPMRVLGRVWNGYAYFAFGWTVPDSELADAKERAAEAYSATVPLAGAYWRDQAMPEVQLIYDQIDKMPLADMSPSQAADAWLKAWDSLGRVWKIHFYAITGPYKALDDLAELYESLIEGGTAGEALGLVQGGIEELQAVDQGIERLATLAAADPAVAAHLADGKPDTFVTLSALPEAATFTAALDAFLKEHGHLGQGFDDLALPSWAEEPGLLLAEVAKRLGSPATGDGAERRARLCAQADALAEGVRSRLVDRPEDLERFERTLAFAREIGPLTEGHNYWIDRKVQARLRCFALSIGGRLVQLGVIEASDDVLFLRRHEVPALLRDPSDRRQLVRQRRQEHTRQLGTRPPRLLGMPLPDEPPGRFGGERIESERAGVLKGTGASAGRVRGTARVTLGPDDFARVQPGDIIVCPSSNPSWVPLFAIAGGLVTNTGGVLSHAAVVAREFGLPAVVGTGDATSRIADGRTVELDGISGEVRLL